MRTRIIRRVYQVKSGRYTRLMVAVPKLAGIRKGDYVELIKI